MHHHHHHGHDHETLSEQAEGRLKLAVMINLLLTAAQMIGGILSGSLALIADALHNFGDAASLLIALIAIRIGHKPPDQLKTFGYKRAETIAALINLTVLIVVGLYLVAEAIHRFFTPEDVAGWPVVIIAGLALVIDTITVFLTHAHSKQSMNIKAAFLHNVGDALASVGVIVAGSLILLFGWVWIDSLVTLLIAGFILWQGLTSVPKVIHLLMEGTPEQINIDAVIASMETCTGVKNVHHVHIWQLDETRNALEAHVVIDDPAEIDRVKTDLKNLLRKQYAIGHSTLEMEHKPCSEC